MHFNPNPFFSLLFFCGMLGIGCTPVDKELETPIDTPSDIIEDTGGDTDDDTGGDTGMDTDTDTGGDTGGTDPNDIDNDGDGMTENEGDCDDANKNVHPDAVEICDEMDNDCDLLIDDEDDSIDISTQFVFYDDIDGDTYGNATTIQFSCILPDGAVENPDDCDDGDDTVYPGAAEICDGQVNDCDSLLTMEAPFVLFTSETGIVTDMTTEFSGTAAAPSEVTIYGSGVLELCGDFYASLDLAGTDMVVKSSLGGYMSSLNAAGTDHVITTVSENATFSFENLLITGGHAMDGGGIFNPQNPNGQNQITVSGCEITGNHATDDGGGIHLYYADLTIIDSLIHHNTSANSGAGIFVSGNAVALENTEVYENQCQNGGGFFIMDGSLHMTDSHIHHNTTTSTGGGIYSWGSDVIIKDTFISDNTTEVYGGGIMLESGTFSCTATKNHGAGVTGNTSPYGGGMWVQTDGGDTSYEIISYACDWGTDTDGDNNDVDDIKYQGEGGLSLNFDQSETFVCNVDGCQ